MELKQLETKDLILRPLKMGDLNDFYEYTKRPEVGPSAGWKPHPDRQYAGDMLRSLVKAGDVYAIELKIEHKMIGTIGLHASPLPDILNKFRAKNYRQIGYVLNPNYWNHGYMTQAVCAVIFYAFHELKLDLLTVSHAENNPASRQVIEKSGFRLVGKYDKEMVFLDNQIRRTLCYILEYDKQWKAVSDGKFDEIPIF